MKKIINSEYPRCFLFEFLGTFLLAYGYGVSSKEHGGGNLIICFGLFIAIALAGQISRAHFNSAVSIAYIINKKFSSIKIYILAHLVGGIIGSLFFLLINSRPYIPIEQKDMTEAGDYIKYVVHEIIGSLFFACCLLVLTNKLITHAHKSWQVYLLLPLAFFLIRLLLDQTMLNPSIGVPCQIIASIYHEDWKIFSYTWLLLFPSIIGGVGGGLLFRYIYQPLLISVKFQKDLQSQQGKQLQQQ